MSHDDLQTAIDAIVDDPIANYPRATVACFDPTCGDLPRRALDTQRLNEFLTRLDQAKVGGLLIGASTGHGHLRTPQELHDWMMAAAQTHLQHAALMALLRPEDGAAFNRDLATQLHESGYQVAFVRPGNNLPVSATPSDIAENMQPAVDAIAEAGLAVGLYSIPDVSGVPMPVESVCRLLESQAGERIVAIKVTEANYELSTQVFLDSKPLDRLKIVQGWDPHLAKAIRAGGKRIGVTSGPMSFAVHQYIHLLAAAAADQWEEVASSQSAVTRLFEAMQDDPNLFADLQRAKKMMGLGEPLLGTINHSQIERVFDALDGIDRKQDQQRLAASLDLMQDGSYHDRFGQYK